MLSDLAVLLASRLLKVALKSPGLSAAGNRRLDKLLLLFIRRERERIFHRISNADGRKVQSGPFAGMALLDKGTWGNGDMLPKLLGTYEADLAPFFDEIKHYAFDLAINVGTADGYYSVGIARMPKVGKVIAVDIDQRALDATQQAAALNNVSDKVESRLGIDPAKLRDLAGAVDSCLVISDCERYEIDLFNDEAIAGLSRAYCLIECHEYRMPDVVAELSRRFEKSHDVEIIEDGARNPNQFDALKREPAVGRWLAMSEGRPIVMHWLIARPKT